MKKDFKKHCHWYGQFYSQVKVTKLQCTPRKMLMSHRAAHKKIKTKPKTKIKAKAKTKNTSPTVTA